MKTKDVSQQMEVVATPHPLVGLVSIKISLNMTPDWDRVAALDVEQVEDIDKDVELFAASGTKMNPRKWVKKREPQVSELDKLKLKVVVIHDDISKKVHMT